jgi:hypothetical protein
MEELDQDNSLSESAKFSEQLVYSFPLASANMRYVEVGEREIFLLDDPQIGLIFRGEIAGCGPGCSIDLSEILLEFAMICEDCGDSGISIEEAARFGTTLGDILIKRSQDTGANLSAMEKTALEIRVVLNSMSVDYKESILEMGLEYELECCPLTECRDFSALGRSLEPAFSSLESLLGRLVESSLSGYAIIEPQTFSSSTPFKRLLIDRIGD